MSSRYLTLWKQLTGIVIMLVTLLGPFLLNSYAQEKSVYDESSDELSKSELKHKKMIKDMTKLMEAAEKAGFPEEELKKITIEEDGETINVWEFLKKQQEKDLKEGSKKKTKPPRYLTIQDITKELTTHEDKNLNQLRDKLILSGENQE
ncbi:hypothetical protein WDW89_04805 [Deltaproteobacteria bacterium TL4]